jgi:hypothetical protein
MAPLAGTHASLPNGLDAPEVAKSAMMSRSITGTAAVTLTIAMFCFCAANYSSHQQQILSISFRTIQSSSFLLRSDLLVVICETR